MKNLLFLFPLLSTLIFAEAKESDRPVSGSHFIFMSGKISAEVKDDFLPVKSFDGKKFHFANSTKPIKPTKDLSCSMKPAVVVTNLYADISELEYKFESNIDILNTMWAINDMESEQMRFEAGNDFENAVLYRGGQRPVVTDGDLEVMALDELTDDQVENKIFSSGSRKFVDTIRGKCSIVSNSSVENAYAALVLSLMAGAVEKNSEGIKRSVVRVVPVGDLEANKEETFKFNCLFPELIVLSAKVDIFLFDGNNKHIASNLSRGLKPISSEELQNLREQEKLNREAQAAKKG